MRAFETILNLIIIMGIIFLLSPFIFVYSYLTDDKDTCLDISVCKEGLPLNIEGEKIIVNEQTCKEYNGIWYSDKKACYFK